MLLLVPAEWAELPLLVLFVMEKHVLFLSMM
jgi:hypothetical protein